MSSLFPALFDGPGISGFRYAEALVGSNDASAMIATFATLDLTPFRSQGWLGKRHTASFGWRYDFDDASFTAGPPLPDALLPLRAQAAAFAGLSSDDLVHALVTRYDPGAGIGWHRDRPIFEHVIGISLGAPATLRFRRRRAGGFDRFAAPLEPGSVYHLSGEARHDWEHSIAPMEQLRWSITFRSLSDKGRRAASPASG